MIWQDFMREDEKNDIARYEKLRAEYRDMQVVRARIRNRCRQQMLKSKNITKDSSCALSQK